MPDTTYFRQVRAPTGRLPDRTMQLHQLVRALATGRVTQAEYDQYMDWWLGLNMLNPHGDNLITQRLWAGLWLPLGIEKRELHTRLYLPYKEEIKA